MDPVDDRGGGLDGFGALGALGALGPRGGRGGLGGPDDADRADGRARGGFDAVVLAGGAAIRLGGVDKTAELVGGRSLLTRVLDAVRAADRMIVAGGSAAAVPGVRRVVETPPGGGPVHGLAAALGQVTSARLVLVAGDLPFLTADVVEELLAGLTREHIDAAVAVDDRGRDQYLLAAWDVDVLRATIARSGETYGQSMRAIYRQVRMHRLMPAGVPPPWWDCDTAGQLAIARAWSESVLPVTLDEWTVAVSDALGLDVQAGAVRDVVLDLARDAAHGVARPAAPLTTFLLGVAVGRGQDQAAATAAIRALIPPAS